MATAGRHFTQTSHIHKLTFRNIPTSTRKLRKRTNSRRTLISLDNSTSIFYYRFKTIKTIQFEMTNSFEDEKLARRRKTKYKPGQSRRC